MKIEKQIHKQIIDGINTESTESGGLLGIDDYDVIVEVVVDNGLSCKGMKRCCYYPNIDLFNKTLIEWQKTGIRFGGIYHTHFSSAASFSNGDIQYIKAIVEALPPNFDTVYFPIILLPEIKMKPFRVEQTVNGVELIEEELIIC